MPLPPPPAAALISRGSRSPRRGRAGSRRTRPGRSCPGMIGTPASAIARRARVFDPISSIAAGGGPIQTRPAVLDGPRERRVLGKEPVTGMHGGSAGPPPRRRAASRRPGSSHPLSARRARTPRRRSGRAVRHGRHRSTRRRSRCPAREGCERSAARSLRGWLRGLCRTHSVFSPRMSFADQLTVTRALAVPIVVALFAISFSGHDAWATGIFCAAMATDFFDGRIATAQRQDARRSARCSTRSRTRCS